MDTETAARNEKKTINPVDPHIPYGRQWVDKDDMDAVLDVLRSNWLTTGPKIGEFEKEFAHIIGAPEAVALSSGTAALHSIMYAIGIDAGDEVIVPPMTFAATANSVVFQGGIPVFADVESDTLLIDPDEVKKKITARTKAVVAVDYAGHPCDYEALRSVTDKHGIYLIADACHALGAQYRGENVGTLADLTAFSFHPVKHITTGEGGMVTTNSTEFADKIRRFRNHGIDSDHRLRGEQGTWYYEMLDIGYNYRLTDIQCALGLSQLRKLPNWIARRQEIAKQYNQAFSRTECIKPLSVSSDVYHAYHLYVIRHRPKDMQFSREELFTKLKEKGIGANVHYIPVHLHPFYQRRFGCRKGQYPKAETAYEQIISLPIFPKMKDRDVFRVTESVKDIAEAYAG